MKMVRFSSLCLGICLLTSSAFAGVADSKHNLSVSGPGLVKVSGESQICIFCHTRYNPLPEAPGWNRFSKGTSYIPYTSTTLKAYPGQPSGTSILCLSCHDGTTAMGELVGKEKELSLQLAMRGLSESRTIVGTDLSDDHPISFYYYDSYAANPTEYVHPSSLSDKVHLDGSGRVQCTSCHDPHDNTLGNFLLKPTIAGELCLTCHITYGWQDSGHNTVTANVSNHESTSLSSETEAQSGCGLCHTSHGAGGRMRLLYHESEENNCLICHNGRMAAGNIEAEFDKPYRHPISATTGTHDPIEPAIITSRHVECVDCHNPHATRSTDSSLRSLRSNNTISIFDRSLARSLTAVRGVSIAGGNISARTGITEEYQLCFRCHADSTNLPAPLVTRWSNETNVRKEFNVSNASYHPVIARGLNSNVPSLVDPLTINSVISCTDCHNNDDSAGPVGPHGSIYPALLQREYRTQDPTSESPSAYALCYKCHDRNSILDDETFSSHRLHITGQGADEQMSTPCSVCHDPHGSEQEKLINFDLSVVSASLSGRREFFTTGSNSGGCSLTCHGVDHDPLCYSPSGGETDC